MEGVSTDSLRALAPKWSLAGDDQLLNLLQSTHQKIASKCRDVSSKLEEMSSALDDAGINLQNVNNKFMALSNSQFIESRVYDDDADVTIHAQAAKNIPPPTSVDEISMLKTSLAELERMHEAAEIMDDSDSDSDMEISVVLKPKDMYSHRPLPYIIGSQHWKNKWHAGLIVEDSDTDSSTSKQDRDIEQYSDSEEEMTRPPLEEHTLSESSSPPGSLDSPPARPADVAAALARRLAGDATAIVQREPEEYPPAPPAQHRKVYKPEQPATSAIFPDEPPPPERSEPSSDDDIFAEINKHAPYTQSNKVESNLAEDLFSFEKPPPEPGDIFSDFADAHVNKPSAKQKSTLFEDESEPELFAEPPKRESQNNAIEKDEPITKKPVGGISLFGSSKGTENIGAAILKRNQRKSSTSGDESGSDDVTNRSDNIKKQIPEKPKVSTRNYNKSDSQETSKAMDEIDNKSMSKKEKDIFDDLFSKSEKIQKKTPPVTKQPVKHKVTPVKEKEKSVKDLFSDNIFDDIDDIFTSDVKIPTKESNESNQKSIFDDDDLFSDIDIVKTTNKKKENDGKENNSTINNNKTNAKDVKSSIKNTKSIFDSDDELFGEIKSDTKKNTKNIDSHKSKDNSTGNNKATNENVNSEVVSKPETIKESTETTKERNLFDDSPQIVKSEPKPQMKSKSIFDSDSDDDIFAKVKTPNVKKTSETENILNTSKNDNKNVEKEDLFKTESTNNKNQFTTALKSNEKSLVQSPSLFEEDEIDDLFIAENKKFESKENKDTKEVNIPSVEQEPVIDKVTGSDISTKIGNIEKENLSKSPTDPKPDNVEESQPEPKDTESGRNNIFDDNLLEHDLFSKPEDVLKYKSSEKIPVIIESSQEVGELGRKEPTNVDSKTEKESSVKDTKNVQAEVDKTEKPKPENVTQSLFDDFIETPKETGTLTTEPKVPVLNTDPVLGDLLTEPPAFEKPAEPKKSKNVNALFDDDSDDESLFFKKNDVISDEKPNIFSKNANFDIFVDEPPAIDVDFTTKPVKNINIDNITEDDLFSTIPKSEKLPNVSKLTDKDTVNEDDLFTSVQKNESVPKSIKIDTNLDLKSVPETQEKVPDNVIEENTINDKPKKSNKVSETKQSNLFDKNEDDDLFSPETDKIINNTKDENPEVLSSVIDSDEELFANLPNLPKSSQKAQNNATKSDQNDFTPNVDKNDEFDDIFKSESPIKDAEIKKIGKLNTKNFNINVNALIPGASPKKVPKEQHDERKSEIDEPKMVKVIPDTTDFGPKPTNNKDVNETTGLNIETVKPVPDETDFKPKPSSNKNEKDTAEQKEPKTDKPTFDEKSDLGVLDNNVSKQRPRIQIKRRPSSRKARHEAVRKSGIDFGDDTDNSSSFDEPKPKKNDKNREDSLTKQDNLTKEDNLNKKDTSLSKETKKIINEDTVSKEEIKTIKSLPKDNALETNKNSKEQANKTQKEDISEENDIFKDILTNIPTHKDSAPTPSFSNEIKETTQDLTQNLNENQQTTTKIVYILNDEDIFNTDTKNIEKSENIFESTNSETNIFKGDGIKTLGKTYKDTKNNKDDLTPKLNKQEIKNQENITTKDVNTKTDKTSLFDDSDEELFNNKKRIVKKTTIFDSDSEEDLFSGKKSTEKKNKEVRNREVKEKKEIVVKGSLFGDDDDDDDLFGMKKQKAEPKHQSTIPSTSKEVHTSGTTTSKTAEPVFDDPLSMLGDDD